MITHAATALKSSDGDVVNFTQTFSVDDELPTKAAPTKIAVPPLTSTTIDFCGIAVATYVFIKTDKPILVDLTFNPTAPVPPPSPATQTVLVERALLLVSEVSAMNITNPLSGPSPDNDANVEVLLVGP